MDMLSSLAGGFEVAFRPENLLFVLIGVIVGTVIGVLPGLGPTATIALLLPFTFDIAPESGIIMLAGVYYGSMYGGTITSVLLQIPGEAASAVTTIDGFQMTKQGRSGPALGISAIGSFIGGLFALLLLMFVAPLIADVAVRFGPPEFAVVTCIGIFMVAYLGTKSTLKSAAAAAAGLLLATIGQDPIEGTGRFTFGVLDLFSGLDLVAVAMGLFGVGEILYNLERREAAGATIGAVGRLWPGREDWQRSRGPIIRGSALGSVIGVVPGGGGVLSSLVSYAVEKRRADDPSRFGKGAIEGVAGPETANNASSVSAFIPLLTLGLPANAVLALILGALLAQDVTPGPSLPTEHPEVFWGVMASMLVGNLILLALNLPLVGIFVQLLRVRMGIVGGISLLVMLVGVVTINNNIFDVWVMLGAGLVGYLMRKTGFEPAPVVLALVLGLILEQSFRQSMLISGGDPSIFVTRPISGTICALVAAGVLLAVYRRLRRTDDDGDGPGLISQTKAMAQDD